eukprot:Nitzschia sp. Nitz4//scaffold233_size31335//12897//13858//NITZ4_007948-RA/size31335-snap-gene-0.15-mRNA-1//1//CDS//3329543370//8956//frame0
MMLSSVVSTAVTSLFVGTLSTGDSPTKSYARTLNLLYFFSKISFVMSVIRFNPYWIATERQRKQRSKENLLQTVCTPADLTTTKIDDLIVQPRWDTTKVVENMLVHGVSVFPGLEDRKTADAFRNFTMEKNANLPEDELVKRGCTAHDDPSVLPLLNQVYADARLHDTLELLLGPDPAVIKMHTISSSYGAKEQDWHANVLHSTSYASNGRDFMVHFSLFIPLQDTSASMGATGICPGTQYCSRVAKRTHSRCRQVASGDSPNGTRMWKTGDAVLMMQGAAFTLPGGPIGAWLW